MMSTEREISILQNQAAQLEQTLTALQRRIAELTKAEQNR
jgi:prefoldin subunit 5